ncbi:MAG: hypothetical protein FJX77_05155 [Armatimonadetes bacterium]|nr:hypothetical protein [Armatimonadota bacterium]
MESSTRPPGRISTIWRSAGSWSGRTAAAPSSILRYGIWKAVSESGWTSRGLCRVFFPVRRTNCRNHSEIAGPMPRSPRPVLPCLLLLLFVFLLLGRAETQNSRPNILILFTDDQRADGVRALGNPAVETPHLDGLVRRGFVFPNAYCFGGNVGAVCTPSRNMLLSGRTYFRFGRAAPAREPNLPASFRTAGYDTYHHGKRGNTATAIQALFHTNQYVNEQRERNSGEPGRAIADEAIRFLRDRSGRQPFLMYLAFEAPHDPGSVPTGGDPAAPELPPPPPVRQRRADGPGRAVGALAPHGGRDSSAPPRVLRRHHRSGSPHRAGAGRPGGDRAGEEHADPIHVRSRAGDGQPRSDGQAESLRSRHAGSLRNRRPRHPAGSLPGARLPA